MSINIHDFNRRFNAEYDFLYNAPGYVAGYDEAVTAFDEFLEAHGDFIGEFVKLRGDVISSDREAAAFMFALDSLTA